MKIENLHEGMVIKNYKELCKLLGIKEKYKLFFNVKNNNSNNAQ